MPSFARLKAILASPLEALHRFEEGHVFPGCAPNGDPAGSFARLSLDLAGLPLSGWCLNPDAPDALIVFGGNNVPLAPLAPDLRACFPRHRIYLVPYPGYEGQPGRPGEKIITDLASLLYRTAREAGGEIDVIGMSLGTGVATWLASHATLRRLVLVTPYDSMLSPARHLFPWLPVHLLMRHRFSALQWLGDMTHCPDTLILGAIKDATIPRWSTERLFEGFKGRIEQFSALLGTPILLPDILWFDVAHRDVIRAGAADIMAFLNTPVEDLACRFVSGHGPDENRSIDPAPEGGMSPMDVVSV
jgi:pimeloyl-ACP methyl ester carboxylesterase